MAIETRLSLSTARLAIRVRSVVVRHIDIGSGLAGRAIGVLGLIAISIAKPGAPRRIAEVLAPVAR
jgi:hypothetical protein